LEGANLKFTNFCPDGIVFGNNDYIHFTRFPLPESFCIRFDFKIMNSDEYMNEFLHLKLGNTFDFSFKLLKTSF